MLKDKLSFFIKFYFPVILWASLIFYFSGVPDLKTGAQNLWEEILLRKGAHIGEYAVLFWLIFRIFYSGHKYEFRDSFIAAFSIGSFWAISDEFHQTFVAGRAGRLIDVAVDIFSGTLAISIAGLFCGARMSAKKYLGVLLLVFGLSGGVLFALWDGQAESKRILAEKTLQEKNKAIERSLEADMEAKESEEAVAKKQGSESMASSTETPAKISIDVPFTPQAPHANWDAYHEEACEEASLIMVRHYLEKSKLTPDVADKEILDMVDFQIKNYGDYKDSSASQMVSLAQDFYGSLPGGKKLKVVYDIKRQDIKSYLAKGDPIIIPAAGRLLGNPNYTAPGPPYHVLVLTGYDGSTIITNDPGTRKGEGYKYNIDVLYNAIHDFSGSLDNIEKGRKAMIVVE